VNAPARAQDAPDATPAPTTVLRLAGLKRLHVGPVHGAIDAGECVAVTGRSGAGKSLLLRMIADLDPHEGDAMLDDVPASSLPAPRWRAQVTYVAADAGWWSATVADHFPPDFDFAIFAGVGVPPDAATWPVARLSTGERQRLALLRAITPRTRVLLLDEPTSGLDEGNVARVEALLRQRLAGGMAILLVTHDLAQADRLARRRFELSDGRLLGAQS
jgi:ABC-type iron transport system FetAB ATPase subunit